MASLSDPWDRRRSTRPQAGSVPLIVASVLLSCGGIAVQTWRDAPSLRWATVAVLLAAASSIVLLELGHRGAQIWWVVWLAGGGSSLVAPSVSIGRAPVLLSYLAAGAVWASMVRPPARSEGSGVRPPPLVLAVPFLAAVQLHWYRSPSVRVSVLLLGAAMAVVAAHRIVPEGMGRAERAVVQGVVAVASAVAGIVVVLVAVPLLYLPGALVRAVRSGARAGRTTAAPAWVSVGHVGERQVAIGRAYAHTPTSVRRRRHVLSAAVGVMAIALAVLTVDAGGGRWEVAGLRSAAPDASDTSGFVGDGPQEPSLFALEFQTSYSALPAYAGTPWADELQRSQGDGPEVRTDLFNVRDGDRATVPPPACECPTASLWLSGGSAVFGIGQRDEGTIASHLVRLAAQDGIALEVVNVGRNGAVMVQEVQAVERRLGLTEPPDLLVFYNGWNDVLVEVAFAFALGPDRELSEMGDAMVQIQEINDRPQEFLASEVGPAAGRAAADFYLASQRSIERRAEAAGVTTAYYFQADALADARQLEGYEELSGITAAELLESPFQQALDAAEERLGSTVTSLRDLFAGYPDPVFLGLVHQNEEGASRVAEAIYRDLAPTIRARAG